MTIGSKPPADIAIDASLVRTLLREQHADLAHLPLAEVGAGWDNTIFRLGGDLAVRLPRRAISAALIGHEQRWLPLLSPRLPLPVPTPVRVGRPGQAFPWPWSIVPWFPGRSALTAPPHDHGPMIDALAGFLRALHQPAPSDAPVSPWRGVPLAARTTTLQAHMEQLGGLVDGSAVLRLWERALAARPWPGPLSWIHGDLHPGNLVIDGGRLAAVIDFGDLTAGDPATDLSVIWMLRSPSQSPSSVRERFDAFDDHTWMRARGWAVALGLAYLVNSGGDAAETTMAKATIDAALNDAY